jgi:YesN/AraC family two-component response regulator
VIRTEAVKGLDTFRVRPDLFDLVITDQTMPHMTGTELAKAFIRIRPDIPVILCSGFNYPELSEKAKVAGIREMLIKPFSRRKIARVIRRVLDGNGAAQKTNSLC